MNDDRLPKIICYSELQQGTSSCGGQRKRFKDCLKANLKKCDIEPNELEDLAADRSGWRSLCKDSVQHFEDNRIQYLEAKRSQQKSRSTPNNTRLSVRHLLACMCIMCNCTHHRSHLWSEIRRHRRLSPPIWKWWPRLYWYRISLNTYLLSCF